MTHVCFKGEKVEKYDIKNFGPNFQSIGRKIIKISAGNNSSYSKTLNLKF